MSYKAKVYAIKYEDWDESEGRPPSKLTLTLPDRARAYGDAMYEISCMEDAIEDRTGLRPVSFKILKGFFAQRTK